MQLETFYLDDMTPQIISDPSEDQLLETIHLADWERFAFILLRRDDQNHVDGSGRPGADGLSIMLEEDGIQYVTEEAPEMEQLVAALTAYYRGDEQTLFSIIMGVPHEQATAAKIQAYRDGHADEQLAPTVLGEAARQFQAGDFDGYLAALNRLESSLGQDQRQQLQAARARSAKKT